MELSSRRLPRLNFERQPPDEGLDSLCRSWSVRAWPSGSSRLPGCTELLALPRCCSCCSRLEGPCWDPIELVGSSTADWNALSNLPAACSEGVSKGEASGDSKGTIFEGVAAADGAGAKVAAGYGDSGGAAVPGTMKGDVGGSAEAATVNGDSGGAAVPGAMNGNTGAAKAVNGDAGTSAMGGLLVASRNLAATMSSGVVGDEAASPGSESPSPEPRTFAQPRKLACCEAGLGFGRVAGLLGSATGAAVAAAAGAAASAAGAAGAATAGGGNWGNCCGLPTAS